MNGLIPVLDYQPTASNEPVLVSKPSPGQRWAFSFRYWKQIPNFGLDKVPPNWFVSLLDKLRELSDKEVEAFITNGSDARQWRYHQIKWNQKNIPIKRAELTWVDQAYRENEEDFPILQFQVSRALGRVVGFWDEKSVFNIVLLDPHHNIQPSKSHNYRVDPCDPLVCQYTLLQRHIDEIITRDTCSVECETKAHLRNFSSESVRPNVVMHFLDDLQLASISALEDKSSLTDLLMLGVDLMGEQK